jgi:hypothetical protein
MIIVYDKNNVAKVIRPCPLMNIDWNSNQNGTGNTGGSYNITLNGAIIADEGSPFLDSPAGPFYNASFKNAYDPKPGSQIVPSGSKLGGILAKQVALRTLFADSCNYVEVLSIDGNEPVIKFYPKLVSISFDEGVWVDTCRYSITLETDFLLNNQDKIIAMNSYGQGIINIDPSDLSGITIPAFLDKYGGIVSDFSENWSIEPDDSNGITPFFPNDNVIRTYRLTRNLSATGKRISDCFLPERGGEAYLQARGFLKKHLDKTSHNYNSYLTASGSAPLHSDLPSIGAGQYFGSGFIYLSAQMYGGYNHSRSESFDVSAGSYSITDTWLLSSGTAYENYSSSISSSVEDSLKTVSINGSIKGLSSMPPSGHIYGGDYRSHIHYTPHQKALDKYNAVSNFGSFGLSSDLYKRARRLVNFDINPIPKSTTIGHNEFTGEITYNIEFDTRPMVQNVGGLKSSSISINDTYPGDVFATIPVIGRSNGPVLQYLGTRTEYKRDVTIELVFDTSYGATTTSTTSPPSPSGVTAFTTTTTTTLAPWQAQFVYRNRFLLSKPTMWDPARTEINNIIRAVSPAYEIGIRKYFVNPPQESWNPTDGIYNLNLSWTYELKD